MSQHSHEFEPMDPHSVTDQDLAFQCPECQTNLVVHKVAAGHTLNCPVCSKPIPIPTANKVVGLADAPETKALQSKPEWEQEWISIQSALSETHNQRKEAGNQFNHRCSEANRLHVQKDKMDAQPHEAAATQRTEIEKYYNQHCAEAVRLKERIQTLDARIKELDLRKVEILKEHPEAQA